MFHSVVRGERSSRGWRQAVHEPGVARRDLPHGIERSGGKLDHRSCAQPSAVRPVRRHSSRAPHGPEFSIQEEKVEREAQPKRVNSRRPRQPQPLAWPEAAPADQPHSLREKPSRPPDSICHDGSRRDMDQLVKLAGPIGRFVQGSHAASISLGEEESTLVPAQAGTCLLKPTNSFVGFKSASGPGMPACRRGGC